MFIFAAKSQSGVVIWLQNYVYKKTAPTNEMPPKVRHKTFGGISQKGDTS